MAYFIVLNFIIKLQFIIKILKKMDQNLVNLIGLYSVDKNPDVTLVELLINKKASEIEIGEFTQQIENQP